MNIDEAKEIIYCTDSPQYFIRNYVLTQHAIDGILHFPPYRFLKNLIEKIHTEQKLVVPKSRQMLVTWTAVSYFVWKALFDGPGLFLFISRSERCAEELIGRALLIIEHLPNWMQPRLLNRSREQIAFEALHTRILSLPATPDAPRMHSPSGVFWDEVAFTPFDSELWTSLQPCLQSGGKFIAVSSSNGPTGLFHQLATQSDRLGFTPLKIHYSEHPEHDEAWEEAARKGLSHSSWQREMEISFDAPSIIVYDEFDKEKHISEEQDPSYKLLPCFRSIDFGYLHPFVLWICETESNELLIFDELAIENITTQDIINHIFRKDLKHGLFEKSILYTAADPAGGQATDAGISPIDLLQRQGIKVRHRPSHILPGIEAVKTFLLGADKKIHLRIHPRCINLTEAFTHYRWDAKREQPIKDNVYDHAMDALRYFIINYLGQTIAPSARVAGSTDK